MIFFLYSKDVNNRNIKSYKTMNKMMPVNKVYYNGKWIQFTHKITGEKQLEQIQNTIKDIQIVGRFENDQDVKIVKESVRV